VRRFSFAGKTLAKVEIDPENRIPDITRANNSWTAPGGEKARPAIP